MKRAGQSTMELTAAMVLLMMLLVASVRIFVWLNERIVNQQRQYESTRVEAGGPGQVAPVGNIYDEEATEGAGHLYEAPYVPLNIFADPE